MEMYHMASYSGLSETESRDRTKFGSPGTVAGAAEASEQEEPPPQKNYLSITGQIKTAAVTLKTEHSVFARLSKRSVVVDYVLPLIAFDRRASTLLKLSMDEVQFFDLT